MGRPFSGRNVLRAVKLILRRADLPDVPCQALRHTAATLLLLQGICPRWYRSGWGTARLR